MLLKEELEEQGVAKDEIERRAAELRAKLVAEAEAQGWFSGGVRPLGAGAFVGKGWIVGFSVLHVRVVCWGLGGCFGSCCCTAGLFAPQAVELPMKTVTYVSRLLNLRQPVPETHQNAQGGDICAAHSQSCSPADLACLAFAAPTGLLCRAAGQQPRRRQGRQPATPGRQQQG